MIGIIIILLLILSSNLLLGNIDGYGQKRKIYCFITFGSMFLFAALRGPSVAMDTASRYKLYSTVCDLKLMDAFSYIASIKDGGEIGYAISVTLLSRLFPSPYLINLCWDLFIVVTFGVFFYHYAEDLKISVLMYFAFAFASSLNATRQFVATAFFVWAIMSIARQKYVRSILLIGIATMFHTSAVFLFAIYLLKLFDYRLTKKLILLISGGSILFFFLFDTLSVQIMERFFPQYWWYLYGSWAIGDQQFSMLWLTIYSFMALILFFEIGNENKAPSFEGEAVSGQEKVTCIAIVTFLIYALIGMLASKVWFMTRLRAYVVLGYCLSAGIMLNRLNIFNNNSKRILRTIFIVLMSIWAVQMFKTDGHGLFPYEFIWDFYSVQ